MSLELDTGRHDAPVSGALLYTARLMTRMHAFIRFLLVESGWGNEVDFPGDGCSAYDASSQTRESTESEGDKKSTEIGTEDARKGTHDSQRGTQTKNKGPGGWAGGHGARGVRCPPSAAKPLLLAVHRLRAALDDRVRPTLRRWLATAVRDGAQKSACSLHAHLAYLHWSTLPSALTMRGAQTLLTAQAYILVNHVFVDATVGGGSKLRASSSETAGKGLSHSPRSSSLIGHTRPAKGRLLRPEGRIPSDCYHDFLRNTNPGYTHHDRLTLSALIAPAGDAASVASHDESLGFPLTEIFDLFQRQRASILRWMSKHPALADSVLEEVVRVLTLNSAGEDDFHLGDETDTGDTKQSPKSRLKNFAATFGLRGATKVSGKKEFGDHTASKPDSYEVLPNSEHEPSKRKPTRTVDTRHADRRWVRVPGPGGVGRFIPETEAAAAAAAAGVPFVKRLDGTETNDVENTSKSTERSATSTSPPVLSEEPPTATDQTPKTSLSYADWMRSVTTMAVEMEVNTQLGEFTVRKNRLKSLQHGIREMPDFAAALGATLAAHGAAEKLSKKRNRRAGGERGGNDVSTATAGSTVCTTAQMDIDSDDSDGSDDDDPNAIVVHCAEVRRSKHRLWMRLVGLRHDVQLWDRDRRAPANPFVRPYASLFTNTQIAAGLAGAAGAVADAVAAVGGAGLRGAERWISERLDPVVAGPAAEYLAGVELFMPLATIDGPVARLAGFAKILDGEEGGNPADDTWGFDGLGSSGSGMGDKTGKGKTGTVSDERGTDNEKGSKRVGALTEVVVVRDPPLVQVFRVESYGRRWRRALVFASQASWCLADVDPDGHPALDDSGERYLLSSSRLGASSSSLVVSRNLNEKQGRQQFVPQRHLRGLLPAALLKEYVFWQSHDGDLYGDAVGGGKNGKNGNTMLHCRLVQSSGDSGTPNNYSSGDYSAVIRRIPLSSLQALGIDQGARLPEGVIQGQLTLVDLLFAPAVLAGAEDSDFSATDSKDSGAKKKKATPVVEAARALRSLAGRLAAVEGLAHCLAWTAAPVDVSTLHKGGGVFGALKGAASLVVGAMAAASKNKDNQSDVAGIDRLELPRLGISFTRSKTGAKNKLECEGTYWGFPKSRHCFTEASDCLSIHRPIHD